MIDKHFIEVCKESLDNLCIEDVDNIIDIIAQTGNELDRLFILGNGGSAANASHAVNDFRKLCNIEAYAPTDNVSELTARINDDGWDSSYVNWLKNCHITEGDAVLFLSVGGGSKERNISMNLINALDYVMDDPLPFTLAILGKDGGYIGKHADVSVIIPVSDPSLITPVTESLQSLILHMIVSDPRLKVNNTIW